MEYEDEDFLKLTPEELIKVVENVSTELLPSKSMEKYISTYEKFLKWRTSKNTTSASENVLVAYFSELSQTLKPSTLWSIYSMLKVTLNNKDGVQLKNYSKLLTFLKRKSTGFRATKAKVLTSKEVQQFLNEALNDQHLVTKVRYHDSGAIEKTVYI